MKTVTQWFDGAVDKPVRVGPYQREYPIQPELAAYCWWNGTFFGCYGDTPKEAKKHAHVWAASQELPWRGLAEKPA